MGPLDLQMIICACQSLLLGYSFPGVPARICGSEGLGAILSSGWGYELAPLPGQREGTSSNSGKALFVVLNQGNPHSQFPGWVVPLALLCGWSALPTVISARALLGYTAFQVFQPCFPCEVRPEWNSQEAANNAGGAGCPPCALCSHWRNCRLSGTLLVWCCPCLGEGQCALNAVASLTLHMQSVSASVVLQG